MMTTSLAQIAGESARPPPKRGDDRGDRPAVYIARHVDVVRAAVRDGVDVRGYFAWSLLDNYEWAEGYRMRFGIVHVDFATQRRTLKASARCYAGIIAKNGADLAD